jgi:hypothetical protein
MDKRNELLPDKFCSMDRVLPLTKGNLSFLSVQTGCEVKHMLMTQECSPRNKNKARETASQPLPLLPLLIGESLLLHGGFPSFLMVLVFILPVSPHK